MFQKSRNCIVCGEDFLVFNKTSSAKICETCRPEYNRIRAREFYQNSIVSGKVHQYRKTMREAQQKRLLDDRYRLITRAKNRARTKNVSCDLQLCDIVIPKVCPILGTSFKKNTEYAMSIDAIDPKGDYTKDNIQIISMKANAMKNSATEEELIAFANWVLTTVVKTPDVPEVGAVEDEF